MSMIPSSPSQRVTVVTGGDGALSARGWRIAAVLTVVLLLTLVGGLAAAGALPFTGQRPATAEDVPASRDGSAGSAQSAGESRTATSQGAVGHDGTIPAQWEGPAVNLDWQGREYARAELGFIGDRIAVPGDRVHRTLDVTNAGPGAAAMTVTLRLRQDIPAEALNADFGSDVTLFWEVNGVTGSGRFAELAREGEIQLGQSALARGQSAQIMLGFEMDRDVETSRALGVQSTTLELIDVRVDMRGDGATQLPVTGGVLSWIPLIAGALLLLLGSLLLFAVWRRRRVCRDCDESIPRWQPRVEIRESGRARTVLCLDCAAATLGT
ncbi:LPXTG cell wall anchor domain-containing protein [Microbacterium hominis]|uniref:LPXTG cell wall anchor domain-containing protein n=1 Tax=Microbacterium hominis TaxID=162426 RepID=UPI00168B1997|nr:LPXTG cell wall anchor domain-containing protein [Microbacterium hominis]QOC25329.1 LPXTG cell wall anchor domain-containing protein [Microbacterium hominis]QOC29347.1 LPXTG cell wall anchor domain-containing protein [Microbacterium hominis]